jgi:hypothetical protein
MSTSARGTARPVNVLLKEGTSRCCGTRTSTAARCRGTSWPWLRGMPRWWNTRTSTAARWICAWPYGTINITSGAQVRYTISRIIDINYNFRFFAFEIEAKGKSPSGFPRVHIGVSCRFGNGAAPHGHVRICNLQLTVTPLSVCGLCTLWFVSCTGENHWIFFFFLNHPGQATLRQLALNPLLRAPRQTNPGPIYLRVMHLQQYRLTLVTTEEEPNNSTRPTNNLNPPRRR